jgi:hypothetical protein
MIRTLILFVFVSHFLCAYGQPGATPATNLVRFPSIAGLLEEARKGEVRGEVQGVVTFSYRQSSFYLQDKTSGLYVASATNIALSVGDRVAVQGRTVHAGFSPVLR